MQTYEDRRMTALQSRFRQLRVMVDAATTPNPCFAPNHRSEIYKAMLKSVALADSQLVDLSVQLARDRFPASEVLVYPMLHLAGDANERGTWHRDGAETNRRVFWIPLTPYDYPGLSVIKWSSGVLSTPLAFAGSRLFNLDTLASKLTIPSNTYFAWSPRMIHRGNFNTSGDLSSAMVIFLDPAAAPASRRVVEFEPDQVKQSLRAIDDAIALDSAGNISRVDQAKLKSVDEPLQSHFVSYFKLRTNHDLLAA